MLLRLQLCLLVLLQLGLLQLGLLLLMLLFPLLLLPLLLLPLLPLPQFRLCLQDVRRILHLLELVWDSKLLECFLDLVLCS